MFVCFVSKNVYLMFYVANSQKYVFHPYISMLHILCFVSLSYFCYVSNYCINPILCLLCIFLCKVAIFVAFTLLSVKVYVIGNVLHVGALSNVLCSQMFFIYLVCCIFDSNPLQVCFPPCSFACVMCFVGI